MTYDAQKRERGARKAAPIRERLGRGRGKYRPLKGGISCAHRYVQLGTLGYFCKSTHGADIPDDVFILSCAHVLAPYGVATEGDPIYQSAPGDGGTDREAVAYLTRWKRPASGSESDVDAAIARIRKTVTIKREIHGLGAIPGITTPQVGMRVCKQGRSTGYTEGTVTSVRYDSRIFTSGESSRTSHLSNQIRVESDTPRIPFAQSGDSGALILAKKSLKAVGMYIGGAYDGSCALATPIDKVCESLRIQLL